MASYRLTPWEVERIIKKLGGIEGVKLFLSKEEKREFEVWRTVRLGTGLTAEDFLRALDIGGFITTNWAAEILRNPAFRVAAEKIEVNLIKASVDDLGFGRGALLNQIYDCARRKRGWGLCPAELGPQLRLQYRDQPDGEEIIVGMESIRGSADYPEIFDVECADGELYLNSRRGDLGFLWSADSEWVFVFLPPLEKRDSLEK